MGPFERLMESWYRVRGWYPVQMAGKQYRCDPDHISFWRKVNRGIWEPRTFQVLDQIVNPDTIYCDIGSWIGPTVLHAAGRCSRLYCFEPDRTAYMYLLQNLQLNRLENVLPFNMALAAEHGEAVLTSPRGKRGDSMTSLLFGGGPGSSRTFCLDWQSWYEMVGKPRFDAIKMDVEGGEFTLLSAMKGYLEQNRPSLYLSLHPHLLHRNESEEAMAGIVDTLSCYAFFMDDSGEKRPLDDLLQTPYRDKPESILLLSGL